MSDFAQDTPVVSAPESAPAAPPPEANDERIEELAATAYSQLAKSEDISEYAAQRGDVDRIRDGEELSPKDFARAAQRTREALQNATAEAAQLNGQMQQQEWQAPALEYGQQLPDTEYHRRVGQVAERVNRVIPDKFDRDVIVEFHTENDPNGYVANWLIENELPVPGEIMQWTSNNSQALRQIAGMPPRQRDLALATLQGKLMAEQEFRQQLAQQQCRLER
jgi:hypothetical protein